MPRTYKKKGVHTSPETAGKQNLDGVDLPKDESGLMAKIMPVYKHGNDNRGIYKGLWTEDALREEIAKFFDYCAEVELKPTVPALQLWLDINRSTLWEWRTKPERHGVKSDIIEQAYRIMEMYLQSNIDKYPTGSIFLLKTTHGHVETSKLDITSDGKAISDVADVKDRLSQLGLE